MNEPTSKYVDTYVQRKQRREARLFIAGFWTGLAPGAILAVALLLVGMYVRG